MKKLFSVLISLCILIFPLLCGYAVNEYGSGEDWKYYRSIGSVPDMQLQPLLVDDNDLLSDSEESLILSELEQASERLGMSVVILTVYSLEGYSPREYADDFYDYNGYGYGSEKDGIILLVSMEERDHWISTTGYGITAFTDYGIELIQEAYIGNLSAGNYYEAFSNYIDKTVQLGEEARNGNVVDIPSSYARDVIRNPVSRKVSISTVLVIILICSGISFAVVYMIAKGQTVSVSMAKNAEEYRVKNSFNLTNTREIFLFKNLVKKYNPPVQKTGSGGGSSVHVGSSGVHHGGGGGKF